MNFDIAIMQAIQSIYSLTNWVGDLFFLLCTMISEVAVMILIIVIIYWGISKKLGEYLLISIFATASLNGLIKDFVRRPRPFLGMMKDKVRFVNVNNFFVNTEELGTSFSFPSNHSQVTTSLFYNISKYTKSKKVICISILAVLLVMTSRVYLGVHYPSDVLGGMLISLLTTSLICSLLDKYYEKKVIILLGIIIISSLGLFNNPSMDTLKMFSTGIGATLGIFLEQKYINFEIASSIKNLILRVLIGIFLGLGIKILLKILLPGEIIFSMISYFIVGFVIFYIAPYIFKKIKI